MHLGEKLAILWRTESDFSGKLTVWQEYGWLLNNRLVKGHASSAEYAKVVHVVEHVPSCMSQLSEKRSDNAN